MPNDLPAEKHILDLRTAADVMHDHVTAVASSLVNNHADVRNAASQVPGHDVTR